jgi:hypothetical protein
MPSLIRNKKIYLFILFFGFLAFGFLNTEAEVTKPVGEPFSAKAVCTDKDGNLSSCSVQVCENSAGNYNICAATSLESKKCSASGSRSVCSVDFVCPSCGYFDVCGEAVDKKYVLTYVGGWQGVAWRWVYSTTTYCEQDVIYCNTHMPVLSSVSDSPDPQYPELGDQTINFNSDSYDPDEGDLIDLYICNNPDCTSCPGTVSTLETESFENGGFLGIGTYNPRSAGSDSVSNYISLSNYSVPSDVGDNLILVAWVAAEGGSQTSASSATFKGEQMTKIDNASSQVDNYRGIAFFWKSVSLGDSGTIRADFPGSDVRQGAIHAITLSNVDISGSVPLAARFKAEAASPIRQIITNLSEGDAIITGGYNADPKELFAYGPDHERETHRTNDSMASSLGYKESTGDNSGWLGWTSEGGNTRVVSLIAFPQISSESENNWNSGGDAKWFLTTKKSFDGEFSAGAASNDLGEDESTWLTVDKNFSQDGQISFYWKMESSRDTESLFFYIDGDYKAKVEREIDWQKKTFDVSAGQHTFKWVYAKESRYGSSDNNAWIDQVSFIGATEAIENDTSGCWAVSSQASVVDPSASYTCPSQDEVTINLKRGRNLFSPSITEGISIQEMTDSGCLISNVYSYNHNTGLYDSVSGVLQPGTGYVINSENDCSFAVSGTPWYFSGTPYNTGIYLIGSPYKPFRTVDLAGNCSAKMVVKAETDLGDNVYKEVDVFLPFNAYWLELSGNCSFGTDPVPPDYPLCDSYPCDKNRSNYWAKVCDNNSVCSDIIGVQTFGYSFEEKENDSPEASFSCSQPGCYAYSGSSNPVLQLINNSTDPNGIADIIRSEWTSEGGMSSASCVYCDYTVQSPFLRPDDYEVTLTVEDASGATDSFSRTITILTDSVADFRCSLDGETWESCEGFRGVQKAEIYFIDDPLLETGDEHYSRPSQWASSINSRTWRLNDVEFSTSYNPSVMLNDRQNTVELTIVDDQGRSDTRVYTFSTKLPLPTWKPIAP